QELFVNLKWHERNVELATLPAHCVRGISGKVKDDLLDLANISQDWWTIRRKLSTNFDRGGQGRAQHGGDFTQNGFQIDHVLFLFAVAAESEDLLHQRGGAAACSVDLLKAFRCGVAAMDVHAREPAIGHDDCKEIIEVMRNAAGQSPNGFH